MMKTNPAERQALRNMARMGMMPASEVSPSNLTAEANLPKPVIRNETVVAAVRQVGEGFKARVKAQLVSMYRSYIEQWEKKCAAAPPKTDPYTFWPCDGNLNRFVYRSNERMRAMVRQFLDNRPRPAAEWMAETGPMTDREQLVYFLKPAAEIAEIIERRSEKEAEEAIQGFILKMTAKLFGILDAKGDFETVTVTGTLGQNEMHFSFADDSRFTLVNDIIINQSCLGKVFNQYPSRFSNVSLAGYDVISNQPGARGASRSEEWMKKNFKTA